MLLDNYYYLEANSLWNNASNIICDTHTVCFSGFQAVDVSDKKRTMIYSTTNNKCSGHRGFRGVLASHNKSQDTTLSSGYANIICGTGNTPVTAQDYRLENQLVDEITFVSQGVVCDLTKRTVTMTKTLQNVSQEPVTIRELGYIVHQQAGTENVNFLVAREVLDEPITVAPGETFMVPMTFQL